ncbi:hypothetical protein [Pararhizobium gei]|uniref:hypothetical protein n=1 Tax=Pararhizobium gei TaxID=1395951 RepID=UPI0023DB2433|nr:hypothetical protein [Rhizobium gei]
MPPISRRKTLGLIAAVSLPPFAVVGVAPSVAGDGSMTALRDLMERHKAAAVADDAAWNALADIEGSAAMEACPSVRVQTSRLLTGRDDAGNDIWEPMYSYSPEEIEKVFRRHLESQLCMAPGERGAPWREKYTASSEARMQAKIDELAALQAEVKRIESECGYTAADEVAGRSADDVKQIERRIVGFVPTTLAEAVALATWVLDARERRGSYIEDDDVKSALQSIANAGRA